MENNVRSATRPKFPKRAVITGGMPYGSKQLHFGHIGGYFVHADVFARFMRDRIGRENVIFVSGSDCYGADSELKYKAALREGFEGGIDDFLREKYADHKKVFEDYGISLDIYAASAFGEAADIHREESERLFINLYESGYLRLGESTQFFDAETGVLLNGRQVEGRCPIAGCKSETAYADECSLGHQFNPSELIAPVAVTNGSVPSLKKVSNWYFELERFAGELKARQELLNSEGLSRKFLLTVVDEFLKEPAVIVRTEDFAALKKAREAMPPHRYDADEAAKSAVLTFEKLADRERACLVLAENKLRYRTKIALVPFRLSGNVEWGIPVPDKDGVCGQTFWVWPESLWAPISFTKAYLKRGGKPCDEWEKWWFNPDCEVYQFIGEDNIYFYALAGIGLFMALNEMNGRDAVYCLPRIVPNRHAFFGNKKASSSGSAKPPSAAELLDFYTPEQLRMHFGHMALAANSVNFAPKAYASGEGFDATLAEGNLLTNVLNRLVRSCFYTLQKHFGGKLPDREACAEAREAARALALGFERAMHRQEFSRALDLADVYVKEQSKSWAARSREADADESGVIREELLADAFHSVRIAAVLLHPFAPFGTELIREYLNVGEHFWDWEHIDEPLRFFIGSGHEFKFLEPRVDFFKKHPSQLKAGEER